MVRSVTAVLALAIFPGFLVAQRPVLQTSERATLQEIVRFDFDDSSITDEAEQLLRAKLPMLNGGAPFILVLEGHTDERGSIEYNLALGGRRAESVRDFLIGLGISADRLTTTSFGEERPLVSRSDAEAWAQNRRVEFVITAVSEGIVAGGADSVSTDVVNPDVPQTDPAVVGGVAVVEPVGETDPPPLRRDRPNNERERRSRFYRPPTDNSATFAAEAAEFLWVSRASTWSADWLGAEAMEEVEYDGRIESFITQGETRTALPYTWVRLDLQPGFQVRLGDAIQIFRPSRMVEDLGVLLHPTGVLYVTRVAPNNIEGLVLESYDRVRQGDLLRPAPVHDLVPGQYPDMVTVRTQAQVLEFAQISQLYGLRQVMILDRGSLDGVAIGDEYVSFFGDGSTEEVTGRIRVVLTEEETSSAEIVTVIGPVFRVGTTVHLDRKMR